MSHFTAWQPGARRPTLQAPAGDAGAGPFTPHADRVSASAFTAQLHGVGASGIEAHFTFHRYFGAYLLCPHDNTKLSEALRATDQNTLVSLLWPEHDAPALVRPLPIAERRSVPRCIYQQLSDARPRARIILQDRWRFLRWLMAGAWKTLASLDQFAVPWRGRF